jgi:hypothetical protein
VIFGSVLQTGFLSPIYDRAAQFEHQFRRHLYHAPEDVSISRISVNVVARPGWP